MVNFPKNNWQSIFKKAIELGLLIDVLDKVSKEIHEGKEIYPQTCFIFKCFEDCDFKNLKIVILGQDPYHGMGEANGLCFSVNKGLRTPPSLRNIFKELKLEYPEFNECRSTDLSDWASQGVLLLNSVLTVEKDSPASHSGFGWQEFTDFIIKEITTKKDFVVFILLGNYAKSKSELIDSTKHVIHQTAHPSPFSAHKGFFGSNVFKLSNLKLKEKNIEEINWN